jgi:excinuclease ABC subunit A
VKLAQHLASARSGYSGGAGSVNAEAKRVASRVLYILDEPTTGLHFEDVSKLLAAFNKLIDGGGSLLEHNLDVIKCADWVIDMGPEGGAGGGQVVATGTPEQMAKVKASHTGHWLSPVLAR